MLTLKERDSLRRLVDEYMQAATLPVQNEKKRLWKALNKSQMIRPMVVIDQLPWNELSCDELVLQIENPYWRSVENELRRSLYQWNHFPVDMVLDPFIAIPKVLIQTGYGFSAQYESIGAVDSTAKSYRYTNQINNLEDVRKITDYRIAYNEKQTIQYIAEAEDVFGDIAPVKCFGHSFSLGAWDYLSVLMSVETVYYKFIDDPDLLHAAMERLTTSTLQAIDDANACGVHNDIANRCHCSYIYTDELLPDSGAGKGPYSKNCWAYGLAQLFSSVSPMLLEEFELPYVSRMAEQFGMVYYGCCERLDDRLDIVKRIPNVRKVSCSPWNDREHFAANIGTDLIMSNKPTPAYLAAESFDGEMVWNDLKRTCELAISNQVNLEIILKDISTVGNDPDRLKLWANIAMRVVENL